MLTLHSAHILGRTCPTSRGWAPGSASAASGSNRCPHLHRCCASSAQLHTLAGASAVSAVEDSKLAEVSVLIIAVCRDGGNLPRLTHFHYRALYGLEHPPCAESQP